MPLAPGTRLGPYEITSPLGAGGMGEVYRAIDTNLKRATAIKVLPEAVATDPDRLARFQREAEVLAALNHPNIAAVYGIERFGASIAMAMELIEGPTLADRISQGAVPVDEALAIAAQMAEGLEVAHEQAIVHRDLKPANVKLRPDGTVKILDFGLARAVEPAAASTAVHSLAATITSPALTQIGMLLGTAAYMSPEQARGRPVDKRADIWAFGCVLFELLTGRRAFDGEDVSMTLAEVIKAEPQWTALPPLPPTVLLCLRRCLIKDPRHRLRDIGEMRLALSGTFDLSQAIDASRAPTAPPRRLWPWVFPAAALSAAGGAIAVLWLPLEPELPPSAPLPPVAQFTIQAPPGRKIPPGTPAIAPDGHAIVYSMIESDGVPRLYLRDLSSAETRVLPGTETGVHPFWSPDGRSLAFVTDRTMKRIDITGGVPRELVDVSGPWHGSWGKTGEILFSAFGIHHIPGDGGKASPAVVLDDKAGETASGFPAFLPDGRRFIVRIEKEDKSALHLASLDSRQRSLIVDDVQSAPLIAPTPRGEIHLLYLRDESSLVAQEFDDRAGTVRGTPRVIVEGIGRVANPPNMPTLAVSPAGIMAYQTGRDFTSMVLTWVNQSGTPTGTVPLDVTGQNPTLSPDGRLLAMDVSTDGDRDIWVADVTRGVTTRMTHGGGAERGPAWSPDGRRIVFSRNKKLYVINADGGNEKELAALDGIPESWSPDDRYLLYSSRRELFAWPFAGGMPIKVGAPAGASRWAQFSPDSRAITYTSNESGRDEVYIQLTPPASGRVRVSTNGGSQSRWGRTSGELYFLTADRDLMVVDVRVGDAISAAKPRKLFTLQPGTVFTSVRYDVDRTRNRFIVPRILAENITDTPITVVMNWWAEFLNRGR